MAADRLLAALVSIAVLLRSTGLAWAGLFVDVAVLVGVAAAEHRDRPPVLTGRTR